MRAGVNEPTRLAFLLLCCCHFFRFVLFSSGFVRSTRLFPIKTYWSNSHVLFCFSFLIDFGLSALSSGFDDLHSNRQRERESWFKWYYYSGPLLLFAAAIVNYFIRADWSLKKKLTYIMAAVCGGGPVLIKQPTRTARLFSFASHIFIVFASISLAALYSQDCVSKKRNGKKQQNLSLFFCCFLSFFLVCVRVCFPIEDLLRPQLSLPADRNKKIRTSIFLLVFLLEMHSCHSRQLDVVQISMSSSLLHYHRQSARSVEKKGL